MIRLEYVTFLVLKTTFSGQAMLYLLVTVLMLHSLPFCNDFSITFFMKKFGLNIFYYSITIITI